MTLKSLALVENAANKEDALDEANELFESFVNREYPDLKEDTPFHISGLVYFSFSSFYNEQKTFLTKSVMPLVSVARKDDIDFEAHNEVVKFEAGMEYDRYRSITQGMTVFDRNLHKGDPEAFRKDPWIHALGGPGTIGVFESLDKYREMDKMSREEYITHATLAQFQIGAILDKDNAYSAKSFDMTKEQFRIVVKERMDNASDDTWFVIGTAS